jgi:hypothetical protein
VHWPAASSKQRRPRQTGFLKAKADRATTDSALEAEIGDHVKVSTTPEMAWCLLCIVPALVISLNPPACWAAWVYHPEHPSSIPFLDRSVYLAYNMPVVYLSCFLTVPSHFMSSNQPGVAVLSNINLLSNNVKSHVKSRFWMHCWACFFLL